MLRIGAAALLAILFATATANAHGGGGAEPMPATNFTDMPTYSPQRLPPVRWMKTKHVHWRQGSDHGH